MIGSQAIVLLLLITDGCAQGAPFKDGPERIAEWENLAQRASCNDVKYFKPSTVAGS